METGVVKSFDKIKRFGFITADSGQELFTTFQDFKDRALESLEVGQRVQFLVKPTVGGGAKATDVSVIGA
ncbi:cold-shock protein [Pseudomonas sp. NPDC096950]|uniref:cold-shock protein n=1 Tax=Pseudomonas sp. NPDC096950 TaxID=3364485 RepID=UPI00383BC2CC